MLIMFMLLVFYGNAMLFVMLWMCCMYKGITALEMAEGKPPYGDIHPMRVGTVLLPQSYIVLR